MIFFLNAGTTGKPVVGKQGSCRPYIFWLLQQGNNRLQIFRDSDSFLPKF
jgi:hypothetical protein